MKLRVLKARKFTKNVQTADQSLIFFIELGVQPYGWFDLLKIPIFLFLSFG